MYSVIKSNNEILINRLNDEERILLKNYLDKSKEPYTDIVLEELTDESGYFGGIFMKLKESNELKDIELEEPIPEELTVEVGEHIQIPIKLSNKFLVYSTVKDNVETVDEKELSAITLADNDQDITFIVNNKLTNNPTILYTIVVDGFKPLTGEIKLTINPSSMKTVLISVFDNGTAEQSPILNYNITLQDCKGTVLEVQKPVEGKAVVDLPVGTYNLNISAEGFEPSQQYIDITPEDMNSVDIKAINVVLQKEQVELNFVNDIKIVGVLKIYKSSVSDVNLISNLQLKADEEQTSINVPADNDYEVHLDTEHTEAGKERVDLVIPKGRVQDQYLVSNFWMKDEIPGGGLHNPS